MIGRSTARARSFCHCYKKSRSNEFLVPTPNGSRAPFSTATIARRYLFRVWKEALQHRSIAVSPVARAVLLDSFTHSQNKLIFGLGHKIRGHCLKSPRCFEKVANSQDLTGQSAFRNTFCSLHALDVLGLMYDSCIIYKNLYKTTRLVEFISDKHRCLSQLNHS